MTQPKLTARQSEILSFIRAGIHCGFVPTIREIGKEFSLKSPNGVICHLEALERKGCITRGRGGKSRSIRLVEDPARLEALAYLGTLSTARLVELVECERMNEAGKDVW